MKRDHVVHKWLALRVIFWRVKGVRQHLFGELELRLLVEVLVETDEWTTVLEVVARELHFIQRRDLFDEELECGAIRRLRKPHVQVGVRFMQTLLQVDEIVAAALEAQCVNLALSRFALNLGFRLRVRNQEGQFLQKLLEDIANAALRDQQNALSVFPLFAFWFLIGQRSQFSLGTLNLLFRLFALHFIDGFL